MARDLTSLLHKTFGFNSFRANQEAVCRAATDGRDVLLVMPTGAGKSLCYQLPAIARGGTALVISPLIALMDDQATKLTAAGLRVARIHSGLSRDEARQACRDYLDGSLQFLFIAPERMRVPNFPAMLAKKKPSLIAIDEAHCISAWGHDFRPDYRTLGDFLPALRPAPVIALTATATPTVQRDIITQLQLSQPELFIHGFRRHNLAIEVVELSKPRRNEFTANLLKEKSNRPAIVYAPSRKSAEDLASTLGGSAAAYHAGLDPATRERVQRHFLTGKLEVVVATIAFGMGIDKADVRTVVHTALPGSVEQYYQEIGRAGRDGLPSRTVLLHSFADRKMHDFFLERDYPAITELTRVAALLTGDYQMPDLLRQRLKMDAETLDKAVEKLVSQGAATIDMGGNIRASEDAPRQTAWRRGYDEQINFRRSQIDRMVQFAESPQCRMAALIQHFGDTADGLRPCGHCDFCAPQNATAQTFRAPTTEEDRQLRAILRALENSAGQTRATGRLHTELSTNALRNTPAADRKIFDTLLDALTRAGLITLNTDQWTNPEGTLITFKKASLTHEGRTLTGPLPPDLLLKDIPPSTSSAATRKRAGTRASGTNPRALGTNPRTVRSSSRPITSQAPGAIIAPVAAVASRYPKASALGLSANQENGALAPGVGSSSIETYTRPRPTTPEPAQSLTPEQQALDQRLREWRKAESEKLNLPSFFLLSSSTLRSIVLLHPQTIPQLLTISGIGREKADRFGEAIISICHQPTGSTQAAMDDEAQPATANREATRSTTQSRALLSAEEVEQKRIADKERSLKKQRNLASYNEAQKVLDTELRAWRKAHAAELEVPPFHLLADSLLHEIVLACPVSLTELNQVVGMGPTRIQKYGNAISAICAQIRLDQSRN
jgi:ATP-dependent DNA helicase RecQ